MKALYWTYGLSWALALLAYALGVRPESPAILALGVLYMWVPGLVALLFARREGIRLPLAFRPNRYWLFAWLFPAPLTLLSVPLSLPFGAYRGLAWTFPEGPPPLPEPLLLALVLLQGLFAGATVNLPAALGEELMWRGYLWERLRERGFWPATLEIGFHWGLWHAPHVGVGVTGELHRLAQDLKLLFPGGIALGNPLLDGDQPQPRHVGLVKLVGLLEVQEGRGVLATPSGHPEGILTQRGGEGGADRRGRGSDPGPPARAVYGPSRPLTGGPIRSAKPTSALAGGWRFALD